MIINQISKPEKIDNDTFSKITTDKKITIGIEQINSDFYEKNNKMYFDIVLDNKSNLKYFLELKYETLINILDNYGNWKGQNNIIIIAKELDSIIDMNIKKDNEIEEDIISICVENPDIIDEIDVENQVEIKIKNIYFNNNIIIPSFEINII